MRIIEETGAIDLEQTSGGVVLTQHSTCGDEPALIFIPRQMIDLVCAHLQEAKATKAVVRGKLRGH